MVMEKKKQEEAGQSSSDQPETRRDLFVREKVTANDIANTPELRAEYVAWRGLRMTQMVESVLLDEAIPEAIGPNLKQNPSIGAQLHAEHAGMNKSIKRMMNLAELIEEPVDVASTYGATKPEGMEE